MSERTSERSGGRERSEQSGSSERVSGASERANGRASGPVLTSRFLFVPDHSGAGFGSNLLSHQVYARLGSAVNRNLLAFLDGVSRLAVIMSMRKEMNGCNGAHLYANVGIVGTGASVAIFVQKIWQTKFWFGIHKAIRMDVEISRAEKTHLYSV